MNIMSGRILLLFTIAALTLITPAPIYAWQWNEPELRRVPVPSTLHVVEGETSADFDADGIPETLTLTAGRAAIQTGAQTRWQSPQGWRIVQAQIADLNRDGQPEATLLVWRPFKPWPVDAWLPNGGRINSFRDSRGESCHIILIGWKRDAFRELWAGSALAEPVKEFAAVDLARSGRQYLVTLEGVYDDPPSASARRLKVWEWNGFGFTVVHELDDSFSLLVPARMEDGQVVILTD
ncbi:MAG TPA: VCBS repeat-containing protein [Anaerolineales bacterium]|nr:VCBS repeat-containing protein [Anaerolineales bacterium]